MTTKPLKHLPPKILLLFPTAGYDLITIFAFLRRNHKGKEAQRISDTGLAEDYTVKLVPPTTMNLIRPLLVVLCSSANEKKSQWTKKYRTVFYRGILFFFSW